jgi:hypothetical protein
MRDTQTMNALFTGRRVRKTPGRSAITVSAREFTQSNVISALKFVGIVIMETTMVLLLGLGLVFMAGCAAFEVTPADVQQKLTHPLDGHLYVPDSMDNPNPTSGVLIDGIERSLS